MPKLQSQTAKCYGETEAAVRHAIHEEWLRVVRRERWRRRAWLLVAAGVLVLIWLVL